MCLAIERDRVALRKESVDRNSDSAVKLSALGFVALRKESVDRNRNDKRFRFVASSVALRKESVDRNCLVLCSFLQEHSSLSARRAWIEIIFLLYHIVHSLSLSARRAWIEIVFDKTKMALVNVALRKESVDRNRFRQNQNGTRQCRSPQGERG